MQRVMVLLVVVSVGACGGSSPAPVSIGPECTEYLSCLSQVAAASGQSAAYGQAEMLYGSGSACQASSSAEQACESSCKQAISTLVLTGQSCDGTQDGGTDGSVPAGNPPVTTLLGTNNSLSATRMITLPTTGTDAALDLNGDGVPDDQLGRVIGAFTAVGFDLQGSVNSSTTSGSILWLFDEESTDSTQQNAAGAGIKFQLAAQSSSPPKYDGTDMFTANTGYPPSQFLGNIAGGVFTSNPPSTAQTPVTLTLQLALIPGDPPLLLPVTAGAISYSDVGGVLSGQLNGAMKETDVDAILIPAIATLLNDEYQILGSSSAELAAFDTNSDGTISASEVMNNPIIMSVLAPDVQLFQNGVYHPNPANTTKDSLSIGFTFSAVKASF